MGTKIRAGLVVLALVATVMGVGLAQDLLDEQPNEGMQPPEGMLPSEINRSPLMVPRWSEEPCEMDQLTEEQRAELQQQMQDFRQELHELYGDNLTKEGREAMDQELQTFWEQLCERYDISCPDGYRYWGMNGGGFNDTFRPEQHRGGVDINETREEEQQRGESGVGFVAQWLEGIQAFFRKLLEN
jgi:DNA-binding transcriptional MerR regulator